MKVKGFSIYMSEKEFKAVQECISHVSTSVEGGSDEYVAAILPVVDIAQEFENKCIKARALSNFKTK